MWQCNRFFEVEPTLRGKPLCQSTGMRVGKVFKMADTKRTTGRSLEEKLHILHSFHGTIYRPGKTG